MRLLFTICLMLGLVSAEAQSRGRSVLMISIDGLRPADVLDANARGITAPNLQRMAREGAWASGVRDALPSVTYPNHTTLVTGVWPARHGIAANLTFDPLQKNMGGWYWYASDIRVPTLWSAAHDAGLRVASLGWPATVGARDIDFNLPEYWRARNAEDLKLIPALTTPGLLDTIAGAHVTLADMQESNPGGDVARARAATAIFVTKRPAVFTLHLVSLDHEQHEYGPGSPEAHAALTTIDGAIGELVTAARRVDPGLVVVIVSDHGFASIEHDLNLGTAFVEAGLIRLDAAGKPTSWDASPWASGGSAAVVLARPGDVALRARVAELLARLAADPASGVGRVVDRAGVAAMGAGVTADFFVDAKIGYLMTGKLTGPLVTPGSEKGAHGYFPDHPEMRATLIMDGAHLPVHGVLGEVDMRAIAPTVAGLLGVALPQADLRPLGPNRGRDGGE